MKKHPGYLLILLLLIFNNAFADSIAEFSNSENIIGLGKYVQILEDKSQKLTFQEAISSNQFVVSKEQILQLGITPSVFWIKIQIKNSSSSESLLLRLEHPLMDEVVLYTPLSDGTVSEEKLGENKIFSERKYKHQDYIFDIHIPKGETRTYYMRVRSTEKLEIPISLGTPHAIFESEVIKDLIAGIYFGIILIMFFYNLFIYFTVKDRSYLYYVVYIIFIGLTQACLHGYTFKYLWPNSSWMAIHSIFLIPSLTGIVTIRFANNFLQTKQYTPLLHKFSYVITAIYLIGIVLGISRVYDISYNIIDGTAPLLSLYMLYVAARISKKGYRPAKYFLLAWTFFLICVFVFVLKNTNVLPSNIYTNYSLIVGSAVEICLLSFALGDKINILKKEKEESQKATLEALQENEKIIKDQNIVLETKVKERTFELETSNKNLKNTQSQLVNAEKMASLGQLTAGIAHEINNPINFVVSNVKPLKRDIDDILTLLTKYGEIQDDKNVNEKLKEIKDLKQELDTDYAIQEINLLLKGIDEGASRTSEIVKGLKNFSRLDEDDLKQADIHEGLNSTLALLNSNIARDEITIKKEYGNLTPIECYPGKLNQVFMNILNNAIQAIAANKTKPGEIKIKTDLIDGKTVRISIKDNGPGMTEEVKHKIFEPFFTTKNVGEGSGLGLSIVYGIIEKHKGEISVESAPGQGAEFIISLPIQ